MEQSRRPQQSKRPQQGKTGPSRMQSGRNTKTKRHSDRSRAGVFLKPFLATLIAVVVIGVVLLTVYNRKLQSDEMMEGVSFLSFFKMEKMATEDLSEVSLAEPIPEDDAARRLAQNSTSDTGDSLKESKGKYDDILADADYMAENNIYYKEAAEEGRVTFAFAGDILFDPYYAVMSSLLKNGGNIEAGFDAGILNEMRNADIMIINNEFPYSNRGTPIPDKDYTFRANPEYVSYLTDLGVDMVSLANNHTFDFGEEAFNDTLTTLQNYGMPFAGAGNNLQEAAAPVYFISEDIKFAVICATQIERLDNPRTRGATETESGVFRCWNGANLISAVEAAKEQADFVIVFVHWGTELMEETDWAENDQALELAQAGCDLVIGCHAHILQKVENVQGMPVYYSLGNFWFNSSTRDTGIAEITFTRDGIESCRFVPCLQSGCRTTLLDGEEKLRVLKHMQSISPSVVFDTEGYFSW